MGSIVIITEDESLRQEILRTLPEGYSPAPHSRDRTPVLFDLDRQRPGLIREYSEKAPVIGITSRKETGAVMEAMSHGAYEILHRPIERNRLAAILDELDSLADELSDVIRPEHTQPVPTCAIVGQSDRIMDICKRLARLSQVEVPVLITGETGTGKELIAESIAQFSRRFGKPFVVINCAAVPEHLLESELFGFEKGSFTGAVAAKEGLLRIADGGTVFLDEVGELPLALQGKLLRFLQTQAFYPIGSTKEVQVDVRVISATNRDIPSMVREGLFRDDLYHRLRVAEVHVPPLRERKTDILPLVWFFLERYRDIAARQIKGVTGAFLRALTEYDWPGNIRELENAIRSAIAMAKTPFLSSRELRESGGKNIAEPPRLKGPAFADAVIPYIKAALSRDVPDLHEKMHDDLDRPLLEAVLEHTGGNVSEAARILGINRLTLRKKLGYGKRAAVGNRESVRGPE